MSYLEMKEIVKSFSGVRVLDQVNFSVDRGEVVALLGQNGAGKSTLIKILSGFYSKDSGSIFLGDEEVHFHSPADSLKKGIRVIYQELEVFPDLSVAENIFAGDLPRNKIVFMPVVSRREMYRKTRELLELLGENIDPDALVKELTVSEKQVVEIARALAGRANIIVMDEPTATLTQKEVERLFAVIRRLKAQNVGIIYITHRLEEVFEISDRVVVLRDGKNTGDFRTANTSWRELVQSMIGRSLEELYPARESSIREGEEILRVEDLEVEGLYDHLSFTLHAGEIVGFFGLIGSGINELALALFGAHPARGKVMVKGRELFLRSPGHARRFRLGFIPSDRKQEAIVPEMSVKENLSLVALPKTTRYGFINSQRELDCVYQWAKKLQIKFADWDQPVKSLSGGNQQKVVLARWLANDPQVLIASEPTQGVDVGTRVEIYHIFDELAKRGIGILIFSSDLPEVMALSDRIFVMEGGKVVGEFAKGEVDQRTILYLAMGGEKEKVSVE
ncbi:sugar ABC transporter ATP-binding protein [Thermatribacter velox]|uniref:Sugar ABC transporter ATP-binding protein n=1 Tax=Thermatribacter velox TaxID=3039681 RepID=A0ABZ2YBS3_9BACT